MQWARQTRENAGLRRPNHGQGRTVACATVLAPHMTAASALATLSMLRLLIAATQMRPESTP
jgi:hypothetical protein